VVRSGGNSSRGSGTFTGFLPRLDAVVAPGRDIHVLDDGASHTARIFAALDRRVLRHGDFSSRDDLVDKLDTYVINRDETAEPDRWTYSGMSRRWTGWIASIGRGLNDPSTINPHELPAEPLSRAPRHERLRSCPRTEWRSPATP
jgi:hypothetical protein